MLSLFVLFYSLDLFQTLNSTGVVAFAYFFPCFFLYLQEANGRQAENKINLPVPVYLRPLDQKDPSMKVSTLGFNTCIKYSLCYFRVKWTILIN